MANTPVEVKKTAPAPAHDTWHSFRSEMDRLFDRFFGRVWHALAAPDVRCRAYIPPREYVQFCSAGRRCRRRREGIQDFRRASGLESKDIELSVSGDRLVLRGEKREEKEQKDKNYYMSERAYGSFQRAFALPQGIDRDKIAAELAKGVLTITLPKTEEAQKPAQKIEVKPAA